MVKKTKLGKVVKNVNGYAVRNILKNVTIENKDRSGRVTTRETKLVAGNTFGVYAGKKMKKDFTNVNDAINYAANL